MRRTVPGSGITDDYIYDLGGRAITQMSGGGWWIRGEIYAGGRHLATYENDLGTPTTFFVQTDWLGTERVQTAVNGTACETITSLPFGRSSLYSSRWLAREGFVDARAGIAERTENYDEGAENMTEPAGSGALRPSQSLLLGV